MQKIFDWFRAQRLANRWLIAGLAALVILLIGPSFSQSTQSYKFTDIQTSEPAMPPLGSFYVHVTGEVAKPGLYEVQAGARVQDAISMAGGMTDQAFEQSVNLARMVSDGEQIVVLAKGQIATGGQSGFISLNSATKEQLESLSGVGPAMADAILKYRAEIGSFSDLSQLNEVSGIGPKLFAKISPQLTL